MLALPECEYHLIKQEDAALMWLVRAVVMKFVVGIVKVTKKHTT
jgi:hypothetical protein